MQKNEAGRVAPNFFFFFYKKEEASNEVKTSGFYLSFNMFG